MYYPEYIYIYKYNSDSPETNVSVVLWKASSPAWAWGSVSVGVRKASSPAWAWVKCVGHGEKGLQSSMSL